MLLGPARLSDATVARERSVALLQRDLVGRLGIRKRDGYVPQAIRSISAASGSARRQLSEPPSRLTAKSSGVIGVTSLYLRAGHSSPSSKVPPQKPQTAFESRLSAAGDDFEPLRHGDTPCESPGIKGPRRVSIPRIREWVGANLNRRPPPCQGGVITRLDHQPVWSAFGRALFERITQFPGDVIEGFVSGTDGAVVRFSDGRPAFVLSSSSLGRVGRDSVLGLSRCKWPSRAPRRRRTLRQPYANERICSL